MYTAANSNQNKEIIKSYAINELFRTYINVRVRERVAEEVEIEVPLKISKSKGALWMLVILPGNYPNQPPIFQIINAKVEHECIDDNFLVRHVVLDDWNNSSSLINAISSVHKEFEDAPPQLKKGVGSGHGGKSSSGHKKKHIPFKKPELKDFDEKVKDMGEDELQTLLDDDAFLNEFFLSLDGVEDFVKSFGEIMKGNYKLAKNQKAKEELEEYHERNVELREKFDEKMEEYDALKEQEAEIMENFGPEKVEEALDEKIHGLEKQIKAIKKEDMDIDDFIDEYREAKKEMNKYVFMKQKIFSEKN